MITIENSILKEEKNKYSEQQISFAINYLNSFLEKLNSLTVEENGVKRNLNELEKIICIYNFVTIRNYNDINKYSQDIIGAINHDCFVCMSFSKLIKILCDECNIPSFIKYSITASGGQHANNEILIKDKDGKKHLLSVDATIDCLNYENVHCYKNVDIPRINALLLSEEDVNKYRNTIEYHSLTNAIFISLLRGVTSDELFKLSFMDEMKMDLHNYSYNKIMLDKIEKYDKSIVEISQMFGVEYYENSIEHICRAYDEIKKQYEQASKPIDFNEMITALKNVEESLLRYENPNDKSIKQKAKLIVLQKLQMSLEFQMKNFDNTSGKSFMFTFVNKALNMNNI